MQANNGGKYDNVQYVGKTGIVKRGYTDANSETKPYQLNADATITEEEYGKPFVTKGDPSNTEPEKSEKNDSGNPVDNTAVVIGSTAEMVGQGLEKGAELANAASKEMQVGSQIAQQTKGLAELSETAGKFLRNTGIVASYVSAGAAVHKAIEEGGVKNWTVATLKTGWALTQTFAKINPVASAAVAIIDVIGTGLHWW
jgi:hypothetical protein